MDIRLVEGVSLDEQRQNLPHQRFLYVILSSTPYKIGDMIRLLTKSTYNHVSLSVDPLFKELYSFARHYRNTPFYGGFVRENANRFLCKGKSSTVEIFALPITDEQYFEAKRIFAQMQGDSQSYVYNFLSAILYPLHKRVCLPNAYTCVEFAVDFLGKLGIRLNIDPTYSYTISELQEELAAFSVYRGVCPVTYADDCGLLFENRQTLQDAIALTVKANAKLLKSFFKYKLFSKIH